MLSLSPETDRVTLKKIHFQSLISQYSIHSFLNTKISRMVLLKIFCKASKKCFRLISLSYNIPPKSKYINLSHL